MRGTRKENTRKITTGPLMRRNGNGGLREDVERVMGERSGRTDDGGEEMREKEKR